MFEKIAIKKFNWRLCVLLSHTLLGTSEEHDNANQIVKYFTYHMRNILLPNIKVIFPVQCANPSEFGFATRGF